MTPAELKAARAHLGLTQEQWAAALGISRPYLGRIETGASVPSLTIVKLIRMYLRHGLGAD